MKKTISNKIIFAHLLRGVAALFVLASHYLGVFWASHHSVARRMGFDPLPDRLLDFEAVFWITENKLMIGQFGVGIFFLISGFVIPLSLKGKTLTSFFVSRIFRIYPVYIVGFSFCVLSMWFLAESGLGTFLYSTKELLAHYPLVVRQWIGFPKIDGISWTLEVEIYFYIFMACGWSMLQRDHLSFMRNATLSLFIVGAILFQFSLTWYIARQFLMLQFMLIGVAFYLRHNSLVSARWFYGYCFISLSLFCLAWIFGHFSNSKHYSASLWVQGYLLAFVVFFILYCFRHKIKNFRILSHFADISYPLYAVHGVLGYSLIYFLMKTYESKLLALNVTFGVVYVLSYGVHVLIEKPAMHFGKKIYLNNNNGTCPIETIQCDSIESQSKKGDQGEKETLFSRTDR